MYHVSYSEVIAESASGAREQERAALDYAIALLDVAGAAAPGGREEAEAVTFVTQLWSLFIKDLAHPGNDLPPELRARLMSVGLWILAEVQQIQAGQSRNFDGVVEVCAAIRDGLA